MRQNNRRSDNGYAPERYRTAKQQLCLLAITHSEAITAMRLSDAVQRNDEE